MSKKNEKKIPQVSSSLRADAIIEVPSIIRECSGIKVFNRRLKSFLFTTDVATIAYTDADAILAVYPQSPLPSIIEAITTVASMPVFAGVGGGVTKGMRSAYMAQFSEARGAMGVVLNSLSTVDTINKVNHMVDCPIISTVVSFYDAIDEKIEAGVDILNVANGKDTPKLVERLRKKYPEMPIIATGGPSNETILAAIEAGANAISWKPPTNADLFAEKMKKYRAERRQDFMDAHDGLTLNQFEDLQKRNVDK